MSNTTYLKNGFDAVKTFMTIAGQTVSQQPSIPSEADMLLRLRLNIEENLELTEAILGQSASRLEPSSIEAIHHMREAVSCIDRMIKQCADKPVFGIEPNMKEVLDALISCSLHYITAIRSYILSSKFIFFFLTFNFVWGSMRRIFYYRLLR